MNIARALVRDLVDKRLWPLAVLLVVALVALPLLVGTGGGDEGTDLPTAAVDEAAGGSRPAPAVELVGPASVRSRAGSVRDPFRRRHKAKDANAGGGASKSTSKGAAAADTTTTTPDSATTQSTPDAVATYSGPFAYRTEVRFASTEGDAGKAREISRLAPLGDVTQPALLYLGVSADGKHATFLLGPAARQNGEGTCIDELCRIVALRTGMSTVVDVTPAEGDPRQYSLEVVSVQRERLPSARAASKARAREHPDGRDVLRDVIRDPATAQAIGRIVYDQSLGVLTTKSAP